MRPHRWDLDLNYKNPHLLAEAMYTPTIHTLMSSQGVCPLVRGICVLKYLCMVFHCSPSWNEPADVVLAEPPEEPLPKRPRLHSH